MTSNNLFNGIADPSPLGFFAFAIQTLYAGSVYAQWITHNAAVTFAPAIWYGGVAQLICGILQLLRGEKVGGTVFCAFGLNWISTGVLTDPKNSSMLDLSYANAPEEMMKQSGIYFVAWACFAFAYIVANLKSTVALVCLSCLVCCNFIFLGIFSFTGSSVVEKIAGYCMMLTAINAFYIGAAALWRDTAPIQLPLYSLHRNDKHAPSTRAQAPGTYESKISGTEVVEV